MSRLKISSSAAGQGTLAEGDEARRLQDGVGAEVVRLQAEELKKPTEEDARRKAEPAVEVNNEDVPLVVLWRRHDLIAGSTSGHLCR